MANLRKQADMPDRICDVSGCSNAHRARGYCSTHYNTLVMAPDRVHVKVVKSCAVCATQVLRRSDRHYQPTCSVRCRTVVQWGPRLAQVDPYDWARDAVKRAKSYGAAIVDWYDRAEIFKRDDWTCWVCGIRCSSPDPYSASSATIDHVKPLSTGGEHSRVNARTCCLMCNCTRRADTAVA